MSVRRIKRAWRGWVLQEQRRLLGLRYWRTIYRAATYQACRNVVTERADP